MSRSSTVTSCSVPSLIGSNAGIAPRQSSTMCRGTAALVAQNDAHGHSARHMSLEGGIWQTVHGHPNTGLGELDVDAPVARLVGIGPRAANARAAHTQVNERGRLCAQTLPVRPRRECPAQELGQATERAEVELAARGRDQTANGMPGRARHDVSEHTCASRHPCRPGQSRQTGQSRSRHSHREHLDAHETLAALYFSPILLTSVGHYWPIGTVKDMTK